MPHRCAFGCKNTAVVMHVFPNPEKYPDRFKIWVDLVGGKPDTLSDLDFYYRKRICDIHFTDKEKNRCKRLSSIAVPSLHLPCLKSSTTTAVKKETVSQLNDLVQKSSGSDSGQVLSSKSQFSNVSEKKDASSATLSRLPHPPSKISAPAEDLQQISSLAEYCTNYSDIDLEEEYLDDEEFNEAPNLNSTDHLNPGVSDGIGSQAYMRNANNLLIYDPAIQPAKNAMCATCCSSDRTIMPLTQNKNFEMMQKLCSEIKFTEEDKICWECDAMLDKMNKFKQRVLMAQNVITNAMKGDQIVMMQTLSHMRTAHISGVAIPSSYDSASNIEELGLDKRKEVFPKVEWDHDYLESFPASPPVDDDTKLVIDDKPSSLRVNMPFTENRTLILAPSTNMKPKCNYTVIHIPNIKDTASAFTKPHLLKEACKKTILSEVELLKYMECLRSKLVKSEQVKCLKCVKKFQSEECLHKHNTERHDANAGDHVCTMCEQRFPDAASCDVHYNNHFVFFECAACGLLMKARNNMLAHFDKMHREQRRVCRDCGQVFKYFSEFQNHRLAAHGPKLTCKFCGKIFRETTNFAKHLRYHGINKIKIDKHKCKHCGASFRCFRQLKKHLLDTHGHDMDPESKCSACNIQFVNLKAYQRHLKTIKHKKIAKEPMTNFICEDCGQFYPTVSQLTKHRKLFHIYEKSICDLCNKVFMTKALLVRHLKYSNRHKTGRVRNKTCEHCGKSFYNTSSLTAHKYTHSTDRAFVCEVCGASFHTPKGLQKHRVQVHKIITRRKMYFSGLSQQFNVLTEGLS